MSRHAYLVLAHGDITGLIRLIQACDDERNDIYIHYDKKYELGDGKKDSIISAASKSQIYFVDRISVSWGGYSIIDAQLILLKAAIKKNYRYYHLVSGVDYPIKSQDYIHNFFAKHDGEEFIEYWDNYKKEYLFRVKYYYPYQEQLGTYTYDFKTLKLRVLAKLNLLWQKLKRVNRLKDYDGDWKIGSNWCSFSDDFARYLLGNESQIKKMFGDGLAVDEMYLQTLLYNSQFKDKNCKINTRLIDWERGNPYVWQLSDLQELLDSEALFARKIISKELIEAIDNNKQ